MRKTALVLALPLFFTPVLGFDVAKLNAKKAVPYEHKTQEFKLPVGIDENGEGIKNEGFAQSGDYYTFPALWGDDSYNTGAGMYRLIEGARYVKATMPKGDASLSWEEAFDVTVYINSKPRKIKPDRKKDFPDLDVKQMDMDVGPYNDGFDENDHRFGPYKRMIKK